MSISDFKIEIDRPPSLSELNRQVGFVMEPLCKRQIEALRKASGMSTFKAFLDMNDFLLDLATKGGRKSEMEKLARLLHGSKSRGARSGRSRLV